MRAWVIFLSTVVGALVGAAGWLFWSLRPFSEDFYAAVAAGGLFALAVAVAVSGR